MTQKEWKEVIGKAKELADKDCESYPLDRQLIARTILTYIYRAL